MKHLNQLFIALTLAFAALLAGCQNTSETPQDTTTALAPSSNTITADCIVSYLRQGQAPYITEQEYRLDVASGQLQIVANEPSGKYAFSMNQEQFSQSRELTPFLSDLPAGFVSQPLATTIFYSFAASSGLLNTDALESGEDLKLEGRWYQPLQAAWPKGNSRVILLKSPDNNRIDAAGIAQFDTDAVISDDAMDLSLPVKSRWLARSYNLRYSKELDRLMPRKIDIFDIQEGIASKKLMVQIELKTIRQTRQSAEQEQ